jgi:dTDP-4-dehydrorhamnose reductase
MKYRKIALFGAGGQLASDLEKALPERGLIPLREAELDITDHEKTRRRLEEIQPDLVINTAAFVRVDDCEEQMEKALAVNALAVKNIASVCQELEATLVQISTDYIFGGEKSIPYREDDLPNPLSVYAASKLAGEYFAANYCDRHLIVRSSGLFGAAGSMGKGGNFVETMLRMAGEGKPIRVVDDQVLTPTFTDDLARGLVDALNAGADGLLHLTNSGSCSWYEFAREIFSLQGLDVDLESIPTSQYPTPARRPGYSVLDNQRAGEEYGIQLPDWKTALGEYLEMTHPGG